jgi:hypothetical protein
MTLTTTVEHSGTEFEVDLDTLRRYGQYYIDTDRDLIIKADVYTHGTEDSRFVTATDVGTDYTIQPAEVDVDAIKQSVQDDLAITVTDDDSEGIAAYYQQGGVTVVDRWASELDGKRILRKATNGIVSTNVAEPLLEWDHQFETIIDRAQAATGRPQREVTWKLFNAARDASPGENEYSARIELVNTR